MGIATFAGTLVAGFTAGNWMAFIMILCVVVLQIPLGIFAGSLYAKRHPEEFEKERVGIQVSRGSDPATHFAGNASDSTSRSAK